MAETLVANGDRDDFVDNGTFEIELYANTGLDMTDVSSGRRHPNESMRPYFVMPAAGFLALHKRMPTINRF
jgi:hypothetical protein